MGLFDGTSLERPVTCPACQKKMADCGCPRDAEGHPCRPQDQKILVRVEKRPGGRKATVARGFDPVASDLPRILQKLKPKCGGEAPLEKTRWKSKVSTLVWWWHCLPNLAIPHGKAELRYNLAHA